VPPEPLRVQVVAARVAQGAEERAEGGDVLADSRCAPAIATQVYAQGLGTSGQTGAY